MNQSVSQSDTAAVVPASRRRRFPILMVLVLLALIMGLAYWLWARSQNQGGQPVIVTAERGDVELNVTALGNLQPRDYVDVGAQVSGQLTRLHVAIGDEVKAGDLLAEIDASVQQARVDASRAQLRGLQAQLTERQAQLELAEQLFQRQQRLRNENATSEEAYQSSLASLRVTKAQIEALRAQIQQTESSLKGDEATLGYAKIFAPMSGTVVSLSAREGQTLNANQQAPVILRIADLSTMTVWTQVSEADVPKLKAGMEAYFSILGNPGRRWHGKLRQILPTPEVLNNVVLYTALFDVPNPERELMTQMSAQVFFVVAKAQDVVQLPMSALRPLKPRQGLYEVNVLRPDGKVEPRQVTIGVTNRVTAEIIEGLKAGERVVAPSGTGTGMAGPAGGGPGGGARPRRIGGL